MISLDDALKKKDFHVKLGWNIISFCFVFLLFFYFIFFYLINKACTVLRDIFKTDIFRDTAILKRMLLKSDRTKHLYFHNNTSGNVLSHTEKC